MLCLGFSNHRQTVNHSEKLDVATGGEDMPKLEDEDEAEKRQKIRTSPREKSSSESEKEKE